jgi:hypothetical protein
MIRYNLGKYQKLNQLLHGFYTFYLNSNTYLKSLTLTNEQHQRVLKNTFVSI